MERLITRIYGLIVITVANNDGSHTVSQPNTFLFRFSQEPLCIYDFRTRNYEVSRDLPFHCIYNTMQG